VTGGGALLAHLTESLARGLPGVSARFAFGGIEEDIMEKLLYTPVEAGRVLGGRPVQGLRAARRRGVDVGAHRRLPPDFGACSAGVR